ncbi:glycine cleavage system aminomethyltransferase T [Mucilaginibacter sp. HD30]
MVPFASYNMPVQYAGINAEHETVRKAVGVFDVSHMGEFILKGEGALDLIQRVSSNDAAKLYDGKVQYFCLPNEQGGIVDDLLVYRIDEKTYMLVVNASNIDKDWDWISKFNTAGHLHCKSYWHGLCTQGLLPKRARRSSSKSEITKLRQRWLSRRLPPKPLKGEQ